MELDGQDVRPEPLEERRKRLARLLSRSNKPMRDGIQLSEALTGYGGPSSAMPVGWGSKASWVREPESVLFLRRLGNALNL